MLTAGNTLTRSILSVNTKVIRSQLKQTHQFCRPSLAANL
ncbi:hypothetical protein HMPREF0868_1626 [Mageeibacillus indolicus UPII9-5]|uniref:Uncharacterized protein n=1 Tax=Mageeibacillus indolicus (strain UPII9-5) TaxID=699246 RepID=D3QZI1_MAGIU|nr:hypothetical protein HMPREF0868_1626 [Mageeibacillus indolicus UPII9-5]